MLSLWKVGSSMKATGIVRRIDDLGRIVVPKEIRRTLKLREGDPMEIYTAEGGIVMLRKYSPLQNIASQADEYVKIISNLLGNVVFLCDKDQILAVAGTAKEEYVGKTISPFIEQQLESRQIVHHESPANIEIKINEPISTNGYIIVPINANGDVLGSVIIVINGSPVQKESVGALQAIVEMIALQYE